MKYKLLALCLAMPLGVGFLSSFFTISQIPTWYAGLINPFFNPPNWVFGPVWTTLYLLMGLSLYFVWQKKGKSRNLAIQVYFVQLLLNFLWSFIFFELHSLLLAFIEIIILWISIFMTIKLFYPLSKNAAYLLIPYILWVSFAGLLNFSVLLLNP